MMKSSFMKNTSDNNSNYKNEVLTTVKIESGHNGTDSLEDKEKTNQNNDSKILNQTGHSSINIDKIAEMSM